jgi:uncharacterized membrane protein AbrB (regulator of aidB expression)
MVNGNVAKTTNIALAILLGIAIIGVILLAFVERDIPAELAMMITATVGFFVGTKFTPLDKYVGPNKHEPNDPYPERMTEG